MREILFRGKRKEDGVWVYGDLYHKLFSEDEYLIAPFDDLGEDVIPETVGQFTGLTDKNGVKIFEGDFVKYTNSIDEIYHEEIGLCVFEQAESNFCLQRTARNPANYPVPTTTHTVYLISNVDYEASYEVIGNIHDNPELPEV